MAKKRFESARQIIKGASEKNHKEKEETAQRFQELIEKIGKVISNTYDATLPLVIAH